MKYFSKKSVIVPTLFVLLATDIALGASSCRSVLSNQSVATKKAEVSSKLDASVFRLEKNPDYDAYTKEISAIKDEIKSLEKKIETIDKEISDPGSYRGYFGARLEYRKVDDQIVELKSKMTKLQSIIDGKEVTISPATSVGRKYIEVLDLEKMANERILNLEEALKKDEGFLSKLLGTSRPKQELRSDLDRATGNRNRYREELNRLKKDAVKEAVADIPKSIERMKELKAEVALLAEQREQLKLTIDGDRAGEKAKTLAKKKEYQDRLAQEKISLKESNAALDKILTKERVRMAKALSDLQAKSETREAVTDLLTYYSSEYLGKENKVTILTGVLDKTTPEQLAEVTLLVNGAIERGYNIVYDGNAKSAPVMAKLTGDRGIAVFATEPTKSFAADNKINLSNDYLRMQLFADSEAVIATSDSTAGLGLMMEGLLTHVLDGSKTFSVKDLEKWNDRLDDNHRNLGITFRGPKVVSRAEKILEEKSSSGSGGYSEYSSFYSKEKPSFKGLRYLKNPATFELLAPERLAVEFIQRVGEEAISFTNAMKQNDGTGGAVVFGSSKVDPISAPLIYESSYKLGQLGYAVATGGSGGAMEVANSGAFNGGGPSIGVPISGKVSLSAEKDVASSTHTKTIGTSGYEERIPVLLDSRKLVIFAPGGNGTIKELATTLVRLGGKANGLQAIVFLDSEYYGGLVEWFQQSNLPQTVKDKLVVVDKASEVETLALSMAEKFEIDRQQAPRKNQPEYKKPKEYSYGSYKSKKDEKGEKGSKNEKDNEGGPFSGFGWGE
jgi:predicted Rossmann-fold nucleotide-binding protein